MREVHPELCFAQANAGASRTYSKKKSNGQTERVKLLGSLGFVAPLQLLGTKWPKGVKQDDLLGACIAYWTATRIVSGSATVVLATPLVDMRGLWMELWY